MTSQPSSTKVIVVGAGIAGPVLATFLKIKGYTPIIYERTSGVGDGGIGHGYLRRFPCTDAIYHETNTPLYRVSSNGLSVLSKIRGLLESMEAATFDKFLTYSVVEGDEGLLLDMPVSPSPQGGHRIIAMRRSALRKAVIDTALNHGVEIRWDHKLVDLQQHDTSVTVRFENGMEDTASFVIGCDGLHSNTRIRLFGEEKADYTGLVQVGSLAIQ
jgi:salicylate hydroxylase